MIKFFRKIRYDLMEKPSSAEAPANTKKSAARTARYLKYAIGEIVLVVIGILIALQINNWNEQRKELILERTYVNRLIIDLQRDSFNLKEVTSLVENRQKVIKDFMNSLDDKNPNSTTIDKATQYFTTGWGTTAFTAQDNTYTDLSQTGNMQIFKDDALRERILTYYSLVDTYFKSRNINENWVLPIDVIVTTQTPALQFSQKTNPLFTNNNLSQAIEELMLSKDLLNRNAATHYWVNDALIVELKLMKEAANALLLSLKSR